MQIDPNDSGARTAGLFSDGDAPGTPQTAEAADTVRRTAGEAVTVPDGGDGNENGENGFAAFALPDAGNSGMPLPESGGDASAPVRQTGEKVGAAPETAAAEKEEAPPAVDYAGVAAKDLETLRRTFPECAEMDSLCQLGNPLRYAQLRDLGLSPEEAYLATARPHTHPDNRSHLTSSVPRAAAGGIGMTAAQLSAARELFEGLSDAELTRLYRRALS